MFNFGNLRWFRRGEPEKTLSHQETFGSDLTDEEYVEAML